jgi:predicted DNA-binding protein (MmcQ/YjbR family)
MFCGYEELDGKMTVGFKLEVPHADLLAENPSVLRSQYFGKHAKWVSIDAASIDDWDDISNMIAESYLLSAPKRTLAKLSAKPPWTIDEIVNLLRSGGDRP